MENVIQIEIERGKLSSFTLHDNLFAERPPLNQSADTKSKNKFLKEQPRNSSSKQNWFTSIFTPEPSAIIGSKNKSLYTPNNYPNNKINDIYPSRSLQVPILPTYKSKQEWFSFWIDKKTEMKIKSCSDSNYWYSNKVGKKVNIIHYSSFCAISETKDKEGGIHYGYICYWDLEYIS